MIFLITNICVMIEQDQAIAILTEQIDFQANAIQMSSVLLAKIFGIAIYSKTMKYKCMTIRVPRCFGFFR